VTARIFLTHPPDWFPAYGDRALAALAALGTVVRNPGDDFLSPAALVEAAKDCDAIVADRLTPLPAAVFAGLDRLVVVARSAMDVRNIDIEAASRHGVLVTQAGPGFRNATAEHGVGLLLALARHIPDHVAAYRAGGSPEPRQGIQLAGRTAGIVGHGNLGSRMAELLQAFGMRVLVTDPHALVDRPGLRQVPLPELLAEADVVVCTAVHNAETENLFDAAAFAAMKPAALFVNISRGKLVDEAALEAALVEGRLAGAALDVGRDGENDLPSARIARLPNVVATPHVGGMVPESRASQAMDTVEQIAAVLRGQLPRRALNAAAATRSRERGPIC